MPKHRTNTSRSIRAPHIYCFPRSGVTAMSSFASLAVEFPAARGAAGFMPRPSEVARVQSACVHAVNASLPTDRFAAAH
jgi:hypothetical protein